MRIIRLNNKRTIVALSIAIAILLWSYVMGDINPYTTKQLLGMSVELIEQDDKGLIVTSEKNLKVDVRISGRRNEIYQIRRSDINFKADLNGYDEGTHSIEIEMETNVNGEAVEIEHSPKEVQVTLERVISKSFRTELVTTGNFPSGINADMIELTDNEVSISGVRSKVESVSRVVASLNVSDLKNDQEVLVDIIPLDRQGDKVEDVELSRSKANVKVLSSNIKVAKVQAKLVGEVSEGYELSKVEVTPEKIKFIESESKSFPESIETSEIDISGLTESKEVDVELELPEGMELAEGFGKSVKVRLTVDEVSTEQETDQATEKTLEYDFSELRLRNLREDLVLTNTSEMPDTIRIDIVGESQVLESFFKEDIGLNVDFSEVLEPGTYNLAIEYGELPEGIRIVSLMPETLEFQLEAKTD